MKKQYVYFSFLLCVNACSPSSERSEPLRIQQALQTQLFGDSILRTSVDWMPSGQAEAFRYTATASGTLASVKVYIDNGNKASTIKLAIYANTNGEPGALMTKGSLTSPVKNAWNTVTLSPQVSIAAGTHYWIAILGPAGGGLVKFRDNDIGAYGSRGSQKTSLSDLPAVWATAVNQSWPGWSMSAYGLSVDVPVSGGSGGAGGSGGTSAGTGGVAGSGTSGSSSGMAGMAGSSSGNGGQAGASGASTGGSGGAGAAGQSGADSGGVSGAGTAGAAGAGAAGSSSLPALPSTGCGVTPVVTGDFHLGTTDGDGTSRDYNVIVPAAYTPSTPLSLTFVYHGAGANEEASKSWGLQNAAGAASSSIFVFPRGIWFSSWGIGWDDACSGRDMPFFDNMVSYLKTHYCIDENRIFVAGFSWGCDQTVALACCRGSAIRAIGAASCTDEFGNSADYTTYVNMPCPSLPAPAVRFTYDPNGDNGYTAQQFSSTNGLFKSFNGCSSTTTSLNANCSKYQNCSASFISCAYPGMGHVLPGGWPDDTWSFFASF